MEQVHSRIYEIGLLGANWVSVGTRLWHIFLTISLGYNNLLEHIVYKTTLLEMTKKISQELAIV